MKRTGFLLLILLFILAGCGQQKVIKTKVPARPAGQQDMLLYADEPIADVGVGVVGLGMRGSHAVRRLTKVPGPHQRILVRFCEVI